MLRAAVLIGTVCAAQALTLHHHGAKVNASAGQLPAPVATAVQGAVPAAVKQKTTDLMTIPAYYNGHATGRGIWKWGNALVAYQRHFGGLAGYPVSIAEVGVQSGGSMEMWRSALGEKCHVYGLDINTACRQFENDHTTITIGDQGSPEMWTKFFGDTCKSLDILIDDGGHEPHQMLTTLAHVFPKLNDGGFISIEDIHGKHYLESFFKPAAGYLGYVASHKMVASIHVYPFVLIAQRAGEAKGLPKQELSFSGSSTNVGDFDSLWKEIKKNKGKGGNVVLTNKAWGSFMTEPGLTNFFNWFGGLHDSNWYDTPDGCAHTPDALCTNTVINSEMQSLVTGVHIYSERLVVEVAAEPPVINAVRRGDKFIVYGER